MCTHPSLNIDTDNPLVGLLSILGRGPTNTSLGSKLNIQGNAHGIRSGWFCWPFNFDPVWLENCDGFKEHEKKP